MGGSSGFDFGREEGRRQGLNTSIHSLSQDKGVKDLETMVLSTYMPEM